MKKKVFTSERSDARMSKYRMMMILDLLKKINGYE